MKILHSRLILPTICLSLLLAASGVVQAYSPKPDLTAAGAIGALKADSNSSPKYAYTYNLGPTGLRGWIYIDPNNKGQEGLITDQSRQILVTHVGSGTPASGVLAVNDVILGVGWGTGGNPVPLFAGDCRKSFGRAIGEAEKAENNGILKLKRWRAGVTTDVQITLQVLGTYTDTAPYNCPKSALILSNASAILANETLGGGWKGSISALALLSTGNPAYLPTVRTFARSLANGSSGLQSGPGGSTWNSGYESVFLAEYYLATGDANVVQGVHNYTVALSRSQSMYGTFGHGGAQLNPDGSYNGSISWYGPVNSAGLVANLGIVLGRKAIVASGGVVEPEIDPAIARAANFFSYFVNKGGIPYGEHEPYVYHADNGKSGMAALMFALMGDKPAQTDYFARICTSSHVGEEYGHTGQGFSYLWTALGANAGGPDAGAAFLKEVRWHRDLTRRSDGSFVYDGGEQYGGSNVSGYWAASSYYGMSPTATYVLQHALPLKQLCITGKDADPANALSSREVADAVWAGKFSQECSGYPTNQLVDALGDYDPVVRSAAAEELGARGGEHGTLRPMLIVMAEDPADANKRQAACQALGYMGTSDALPALGRRLSDPDLWVRGRAAQSLGRLGSSALPELSTMMTAFIDNATDPDVIVWDDPIQIANGYLAKILFQTQPFRTQIRNTSTGLFYPAVRAGLKQPDGRARTYLSSLISQDLTWEDVQAVAPSLIEAVAERSPADQMFSEGIRYAGLSTLGKFQVEEGIPLCLMVKEQTWHGDDWKPFELLRDTYGTAAKEVLPTLYVWQGNLPVFAADSSIKACCPGRYENIEANIASTIAVLESDTPPPALNHFKTVTVADANLGVSLAESNSVLLSATATDLDGGVPRFTWSKVSGPGPVSFSSNDSTASADTIASFSAAGAYVLRVSVTDSSIMNEGIWWKPHRLLGYYDFQTYDHNYGTVHTDVTVEVVDNPDSPPLAPAGLAASAGDALVDLSWNASFRATSYNVKRATSPGGPYSPLATTAATSYQDAAVVNGTSYYYVISAVNGFGASADSTEAGVMPVLTTLSINVNLDTIPKTGLVGPAGGLGETWNQVLGGPGGVSGLGASALLGSNGTATSVGFTSGASHLFSWGSPPLTLVTSGAFQWNWNTPSNLVINGLAAGGKYDLYIASFHPNELGSSSLFSTSNPTSTVGTQIANSGGPNGNNSTWVEGVNYVLFEDIEPDTGERITITMVGDSGTNAKRAYLSGFQLVQVGGESPSPFRAWAADPAQGLTAGVNDGPLDDPELDGLVNLLEFVLGGHPLLPSHAVLPTLSPGGGGAWLFEYERSNLSEPPATTQVVEYGSDLEHPENWTEVTIPLTSAGTVTITPGSPSDHVSVALPDLGGMGFARLKVSE